MIAQRTSGWPKRAFSAATRMSQASTSSVPPASAKPFTAAMSGFHVSKRVIPPKLKSFSSSRFARAVSSGISSLRSAPAQKARSPAPVRMPTQASSSRLNSAQASSISLLVWRSTEFNASGRLIVTVTTWPDFSYRIGMAVPSPLAHAPARPRVRPQCSRPFGPRLRGWAWCYAFAVTAHHARHEVLTAPDGSPVELYALLPPDGEPEFIHAAVPSGATLLELGCGAGRVTHALIALGHGVVAVDESPAMLAHIRGAETVESAIETLDLGRCFAGVVLGSYLINMPHDAQRAAFLRTCRRHVAPNGVVLISATTRTGQRH